MREGKAKQTKSVAERYIMACHECDALQHVQAELARREVVLCSSCNALLHKFMPASAVERSLALYLSALILFIIANLFPFITLKMGGREETDLLLSGPAALFAAGNFDIAMLVLLTSIVFPLLTMFGALYLLIPAYFGRPAPAIGIVYRAVHRLMPWSMVGVFMLGVIIAVVKLLDMAHLEFGIALVAFAALVPVLVIAQQHFNSTLFWPPQQEIPGLDHTALHGRAHHHALLHCHTCAYLVRQPDHGHGVACPRCGDTLHRRKPDSLQRTWALLITGMMLFIPANVFPIMTVISLGQGEPSTILGGVSHLVAAGMWPLGMIVFFASIMVPISKFVAMIYLLWSVRRGSSWRPEDRTRLYRITEAIGSWSMVDIFVIALLTSLVNLGALATIQADIAASFFAATVVVTMLAARSFDPRLLWDALEEKAEAAPFAEPAHA